MSGEQPSRGKALELGDLGLDPSSSLSAWILSYITEDRQLPHRGVVSYNELACVKCWHVTVNVYKHYLNNDYNCRFRNLTCVEEFRYMQIPLNKAYQAITFFKMIRESYKLILAYFFFFGTGD